MFRAVPAAEMQAAQMLSGVAMALFLTVGLVPALRPYAARIRAWLLGVYLLGCVAFVAYALAA